MRTIVVPPPSLADAHTLVAQRYAGYFAGHPYRAAQQRVDPEAIKIDWDKPWKEPMVGADECVFCRDMSDTAVERRVHGYQHAIDIEVLRPHSLDYSVWLASGSDEIPELHEVNIDGVPRRRGVNASQENRRKFIELQGKTMDITSVSMVNLPLRLKRKLCIEWNHLYRDWLNEHPDVRYDFETREFYRDIVEEPAEEEHWREWWRAFMPAGRRG